MGNFDFLLSNKEYESFSVPCIEAEKMVTSSAVATAFMARRALEQAVHWVYSHDSYLEAPYRPKLSTLIWDDDFKEILEPELHNQIDLVRRWGNHAAHGGEIKKEEAVLSLHNLYQFVNFIDYCYSNEFVERHFDESLLVVDGNIKQRETQQTMERLEENLPAVPDFYEQMASQTVEVQKDYTAKRESAPQRQEVAFTIDRLSEDETRKLFIDIDLRLAGWQFDDNCRTEVPVNGLKNISGKGYCDYVLYGQNGKILAVVEAKKASVSPEVGEVQVKEYADVIEKEFGYRPICFFTNGLKHYILDDDSRREVAGFYSQDELQLMMDRRFLREPLDGITCKIKDSISSRYYQKEAITRVCEAFSSNRRQALLVMATGSGKTRTAVSLVDILSRHNWVKNILFLADRTSLVKQAYDSFRKLLPDMSVCNLLEDKESARSSRMIFSTYPTMLGAINEQDDKSSRPFTVGHFDLIIIDESHRSIYEKYKAIFEYFDARVVGLTATPRQDLDKSTYGFFNLESGVPTYAYDLSQAVEDHYLVSYHSIETQLKLPTVGLHYDDLSPEEKDYFDGLFEDDEEERDIDGPEFNNRIFNKSTVEIVLDELMTKGIQTASGDEIGKTIIFAKNHRHAEFIREVFMKRYPEKGSDYAQVIDYSIKHYQFLIDDFKVKGKLPQIAISVDMLDTGIDVPEVVNLVFFKKVRSKIKFWQMIGRGTRLCPDLFGPGQDKENFLVFDYGDNFSYFRADPQEGNGRSIEPLSQKLINIKVDLIRELQALAFQEDEFARNYREELVSELHRKVNALSDTDFRVRMVLDSVYTYKNIENWQTLSIATSKDIKTHLSPLLFDESKEDEMARRFDYWMLQIQVGHLLDIPSNRNIRQVMESAQALQSLANIPQVFAQAEVIKQVQETEFWTKASLSNLENVRLALRDLLQYLDKDDRKMYFVNFEDQILSTDVKDTPLLDVNDLRSYKEKVEHYLRAHIGDDEVISKLYHNKKLTSQDLLVLEDLLWEKLGTKSDYERDYKGKAIPKLIREIIGLDREAVNDAFSNFMTNENLNSQQISFIQLIINYIVENGYLEKTMFAKEPFKSYGSLQMLFAHQKPVLQNIVQVIDLINSRATEVG